MQIPVQVVNAFADSGEGGNPAGVVLDADRLSADQKLHIAAATGMSETAFVSASQTADFKLDFFTPTRQIPHCGHATIATFCHLQSLGRLPAAETSKETIDGNRRIVMRGDMAFMEQSAPRYTAIGKWRRAVLDALQLHYDDLPTGAEPVVADTGNAFLLVPLNDAGVVERIKPDRTAVATISEKFNLIGFYVFSRTTRRPGRDAGARMFAPRYGIEEESATGMAAGPLACLLHDRLAAAKTEFEIEQGYLMQPPSPSVITVNLNASDGQITSLLAGGRAIVKRTLSIEI